MWEDKQWIREAAAERNLLNDPGEAEKVGHRPLSSQKLPVG